MRILRYLLTLLLSLTILSLAACDQKPKDTKVVASVNDSDIPLADLQDDISCSLRQFPTKPTPDSVEDRLETMIERKLMIQEAARRGLFRDERFLRTIKTYWEQTLIRELVDDMNQEWADTLRVTDDEVRREYRRMGRRPVIRAARAKTRALAEEYRTKMQKGEGIDCAETLGPCLYDDLKTSPLSQAFDLEAGQTMIIGQEGGFIAVRVLKIETVPLPPLKGLKNGITESLMEQKKQQALADWVAARKKSSKITIHKATLKEAGYGR